MKQALVLIFLNIVLTSGLSAQSKDAPASRADVERYMKVMQSQETVQRTIEAMKQPMHNMVHQQFEKNQDKLPPDFESRMDKMMDEMLLDFPYDQMLQAMIPAYQRHLSKVDVDSLITFYSSATGQKLIRELPQITAESMTAGMPLIQKHTEKVTREFQDQLAAELKKSQKNTQSQN